MKTERLNYYRSLARRGNANAKRVCDAFNPDQPREPDGKWGGGGSAASQHEKEAREHEAAGRFGRAAGSYFEAGREHAKAGRYKEEAEARANEIRVRQLSASKERLPLSSEKTFESHGAAAQHAAKLRATNPGQQFRATWVSGGGTSGGPAKFSVQQYTEKMGWHGINAG